MKNYVFQNLDLMGQMEIENNGVPLAAHFKENDLTLAMQNPSSSQILTALDPWISPYRSIYSGFLLILSEITQSFCFSVQI